MMLFFIANPIYHCSVYTVDLRHLNNLLQPGTLVVLAYA